jgi:hypothetical protein
MEPKLGVIKEVQGRVVDLLVLRCAPHREIAVAMVEPRKWVTRAVVLQEFDLVDSRKLQVTIVFAGIAVAAVGPANGADCVVDAGGWRSWSPAVAANPPPFPVGREPGPPVAPEAG